MTLRWRYPFDDGVVIDRFQVAVVQLPDEFIPLAQYEEALDRRRAEREARREAGEPVTDSDSDSDSDSAAELGQGGRRGSGNQRRPSRRSSTKSLPPGRDSDSKLVPADEAEDGPETGVGSVKFGSRSGSGTGSDSDSTSTSAGSSAVDADGVRTTKPKAPDVDLDALEVVIHNAGHLCQYVVGDSQPYTPFRVRVRAHTMVGWGGWGKWALVTTKGEKL